MQNQLWSDILTQQMHWETISQLREPYNDAVNYRSRNQKEFFQKIFLQTEALKKVLEPQVYFLMGEKGSGKTAYAIYLENNVVDEHKCQLTTMTETQYQRFVALKRQGKMEYSDYANIWRSMLLFLVGRMVVEKSKNPLHLITGKFSKVEREINRWSKNALNPEVETAFEAIRSEVLNAKVKADKFGEAGGELKNQLMEKDAILRHHLLDTENSLKEAISSLKLSSDHILFLDGIDHRPESISYQEYIACIKGLGEAIWQLNTEYFNKIRDSKGRIKIVLLVRPDVFHALNLYNSNSRLQDNCVFLEWSTTEKDYQSSELYELSGRYFSVQQRVKPTTHAAWMNYFKDQDAGQLFKRVLKNSFHKPRDILTFIKIARKHSISSGFGSQHFLPERVTAGHSVGRDYSDYLLGEVRNYAAFYMHGDDFPKYLKFFQFLNGQSRFSFGEFSVAFDKFKKWANGENFHATEYLRDAESLLQLYYDVNVIGYTEAAEMGSETYVHWSYRERSANNIAPQVKTVGDLRINPGISKSLDIGKKFVAAENQQDNKRKMHSQHRGKRGRPNRRAV